MKDINKVTLLQDREMLVYMISKYTEAIWDPQIGQKTNFNNQPKLVQMYMYNMTVGLKVAIEAAKKLIEIGVIED